MTSHQSQRPEESHELATSALSSTAPPSAFDTQFGPRATSVTEFSSTIDVDDTLSADDAERLFRDCGGRTRIADSLVRARIDAGLPAVDDDPDRTVAMLVPELTPDIRGTARESGALYLLALFAWAPRLTPGIVDLVHSAFAAAQVKITATPDDLTSLLTSEGLLTVTDGAGSVGNDVSAGVDTSASEGEVFAVPSFIRILIRRLTDVDAELAAMNPREALGAAIADTIGRQRSDRRDGLAEVLELVVEIRDWRVLERGWARRSVNVFIDVPTSIEAYLGVPEDVLAKNPILTLARSAARRIDSTRTQLGTDDPATLVAKTDFSSIVLPELHGLLTAEPALSLAADEVAVATMLEARSMRLARESEAALNVLEVGRKRLRNLGAGEPGPTLMLQAELNLEHGRNLVLAGRFPEAVRMLQRVTQFAEIYAPNSPHPLLSGLVETALTEMGHGHGSDMDRNLDRARESARRIGMDTLPEEYTALCLEMMRGLDRLDLDAAERILSALDGAQPTQYLGPIPDTVKSLYYVYRGRASVAAKLLTESSRIQFLPTEGGPSSRFSGIVNIAGFVLAAAGETKVLQDLGDRMNPHSPGYSLVRARQALAFGQHDRLWTVTAQSLAGDGGPRLKSCVMALRADLLHHEGRADEAREAFVHVLDYCALTASVLAIAQLSKSARDTLIASSERQMEWEFLARSFNASDVTAAELQRRLLDLPETAPVAPDFQTDLSPTEQSLLFAIDSTKSVSQIARDFGVVSGTLKNRLSALYRKLGVRNRSEAVAYAHRHQLG